jgi:hypothetical protein
MSGARRKKTIRMRACARRISSGDVRLPVEPPVRCYAVSFGWGMSPDVVVRKKKKKKRLTVIAERAHSHKPAQRETKSELADAASW